MNRLLMLLFRTVLFSYPITYRKREAHFQFFYFISRITNHETGMSQLAPLHVRQV